jgi:hypothetical protein
MMKRMLAVLVGAGIAVGGGAAAWAAPNGANREAAKACLADAKAANPNASKADLRAAVRSCLEAQGITGPRKLTPEQQATRAALRTCLQGVKAANPNADRAQLRELAKPCFEQAGIDPAKVGAKLAKLQQCAAQVRADHPDATRAELRSLVRDCVRAG